MNVTFALQLSGHLRYLCHSEQSFKWLEDEINKCRGICSAHAFDCPDSPTRCLLFLHTWDRLHPAPWSANRSRSAARSSPAEHRFYAASSLDCVAKIHARLNPAAIRIESQPATISPEAEALEDQPYSRLRDLRDVSPRAAGLRGFQPPADLVPPNFLPIGRDLISLSGSRAMYYGIAAASRMRREHCAHFGCGAAPTAGEGGDLPLIAVRMRPDVYEPSSAPNWARLTIVRKTRTGGWFHNGLPRWREVVRAIREATAARPPIRRGASMAGSVFGCGPPGAMVAGAKGGDTCYWSTSTNDDRVAAELGALTTGYMQSNVCRRRQLEWSLATVADPQLTRSRSPPPPCEHLPNFWSSCAPPSSVASSGDAGGGGEARLTQPGFPAGCVVEGLLSLAIERGGLERRATPRTAMLIDGR